MKKTVLYDEHVKLGAKTAEFGGFLMPIQYSSIIKEHGSVRNNCGIFDVSHMGEMRVQGSGSLDFLQYICTNDIRRLKNNDILYTCMCYENGGCVDDILVYRFSEEDFLCVVNASNIKKDHEWFTSNNSFGANIEDLSESFSQIALQGPASAPLVSEVFPGINLPAFFRFIEYKGHIISRTGYTGEDGFEIYMKNNYARDIWIRLMEKGRGYSIAPIGLGARDTLRFEACLPLYGHELSKDISPLEAGLKKFVRLNKASDFIGKDALININDRLPRILTGLKMTGRGIAREGYIVEHEGEPAGTVTSGSFCPTLDDNYALALLDSRLTGEDDFEIQIRNNKVHAKRTEIPFYKKRYKKQEV